ncbi:MAG: hypothetical protein H7Y15_07235 [Pseudonocardia sp.]|nr:hypothetical protein [Pseudonocardia sp.]
MVQILPAGVPVLGVPLPHEFGGGAKQPRSCAQLVAAGLVAPADDPWCFFDLPRHAGERGIATWLGSHGVEVRSVGVDSRPTPDAVIDAAGVTVEFKTIDPDVADPASAVYQRIRQARKQSPLVVVDVRGTAATRTDVNRAMVAALRRGGRDLHEVAVVGDGFVVSWP